MTGIEVLAPGECVDFLILGVDDLDEEYSDSTIKRVRGQVSVWAPSATPAGSFAGGAFGVIEVEGADEVASVPYCPWTDSDASWLWHSYYHLMGGTNATHEVHEGAAQRILIDSLAMRRLEAGDSWLAFVMEAAPVGRSNFSPSAVFDLRYILSER